MQNLTINGKEIQLNIFGAEFEIVFTDESTGLQKAIECEELTIKTKPRYIRALWACYDITPSGQKINKKRLPIHITTPEDFDFFENAFGLPIKKYALNGLFRNLLNSFGISSFALYDDQLNLIQDQPVPFPEPPEEEIFEE